MPLVQVKVKSLRSIDYVKVLKTSQMVGPGVSGAAWASAITASTQPPLNPTPALPPPAENRPGDC